MFERKISKNGIELQPDPTDEANIVVASVSGGKDSTALSLWLTEQGIEHRRVFADTGWEHPSTLDYVHNYLPSKLGPIDVVRGELSMVDLVRKKGMFPSRVKRFCTENLKIFPIAKYILEHTGDKTAISAIGVRAAESKARSKLGEWDVWAPAKCFVWRPLINWTESEIIEMHKRHNVRPNPLYLKGASRVGCWPCIFARKREIKLVADLSPERIDEIRELEVEVTAGAQARADAKGEPLRHKRTFFQKLGVLRTEMKKSRSVPIDKAVEWSRTSRGGKQYEMFANEQEGCVRWGLCEGAGSPGWTQGDDDEGLK